MGHNWRLTLSFSLLTRLVDLKLVVCIEVVASVIRIALSVAPNLVAADFHRAFVVMTMSPYERILLHVCRVWHADHLRFVVLSCLRHTSNVYQDIRYCGVIKYQITVVMYLSNRAFQHFSDKHWKQRNAFYFAVNCH